MKILLVTLSLLSTSVAFSAETPKGLGQTDPQQCACQTCFARTGVCDAIDQSPPHNRKANLGSKQQTGGKRRASKIDGQ